MGERQPILRDLLQSWELIELTLKPSAANSDTLDLALSCKTRRLVERVPIDELGRVTARIREELAAEQLDSATLQWRITQLSQRLFSTIFGSHRAREFLLRYPQRWGHPETRSVQWSYPPALHAVPWELISVGPVACRAWRRIQWLDEREPVARDRRAAIWHALVVWAAPASSGVDELPHGSASALVKPNTPQPAAAQQDYREFSEEASFSRRAIRWAGALRRHGILTSVYPNTEGASSQEISKDAILNSIPLYDILIFIGHGEYDAGRICWRIDPATTLSPDDIARVRDTHADRLPRIVIADACWSAALPEDEPTRSFVSAFTNGRTGCFVGYLGAPEIADAERMSDTITDAIGAGCSVAEAVRRARRDACMLPGMLKSSTYLIMVGDNVAVAHEAEPRTRVTRAGAAVIAAFVGIPASLFLLRVLARAVLKKPVWTTEIVGTPLLPDRGADPLIVAAVGGVVWACGLPHALRRILPQRYDSSVEARVVRIVVVVSLTFFGGMAIALCDYVVALMWSAAGVILIVAAYYWSVPNADGEDPWNTWRIGRGVELWLALAAALPWLALARCEVPAGAPLTYFQVLGQLLLGIDARREPLLWFLPSIHRFAFVVQASGGILIDPGTDFIATVTLGFQYDFGPFGLDDDGLRDSECSEPQLPYALGHSCSAGECASGLECSDGRCGLLVRRGARCDATRVCSRSLVCNAGYSPARCTPRGGVAERCAIREDCRDDLACRVAASGGRTCQPPVVEWASCSEVTDCAAGSICSTPFGPSECVPHDLSGRACTFDIQDCGFPASACNYAFPQPGHGSGTCLPRWGENGPCGNDDDECQDSFECDATRHRCVRR